MRAVAARESACRPAPTRGIACECEDPCARSRDHGGQTHRGDALMLPNHPTPEREEPATSPALARRRDHMLRSDATRQVEPRLVPAAERDQPSLLPPAAFDVP